MSSVDPVSSGGDIPQDKRCVQYYSSRLLATYDALYDFSQATRALCPPWDYYHDLRYLS